jgi:hypothetical protein
MAVNLLCFKLFGVLPGAVVLAGPVAPVDPAPPQPPAATAPEDGVAGVSAAGRNRVRACFGPPRVALGRLPALSVGPASAVLLDTTYLGPRLRVSRGGTSGTPFVFQRLVGPAAAAAAARSTPASRPPAAHAAAAAAAAAWARAEAWRPLVARRAGVLTARALGKAAALAGVAGWAWALRWSGAWPSPAVTLAALGLAAAGAALATSGGGIDDRQR